MGTSKDVPGQQFVSEGYLEALTGISRRTFQKHRLHGRGPRYYKLCGSVRYNIEEVLSWVKAQAAGGDTEGADRSNR